MVTLNFAVAWNSAEIEHLYYIITSIWVMGSKFIVPRSLVYLNTVTLELVPALTPTPSSEALIT